MANALPKVYLVRHGETAWSLSGQHTGKTDLPLTDRGEQKARAIGQQLRSLRFDRVLTSPLQRAARTCELAGFDRDAVVDPDLVEWDYGLYEGKRTAEIRAAAPGWQLFRDGCPSGESVAAISARADRVVARLRGSAADGNTLVFSSGHILRVIAARWIGLDAQAGALLVLDTASISILGYNHDVDEPVLRLWNNLVETRP